MSEKLLTHKDLSTLLGVSETTVKSYRRKFPGSIPVANKGKPIRFKPEAAKICLRIRDLFGQGMSVEEVGARLTQEFGWRRPRNVVAASQEGQKSAALAGRKNSGSGSADLSQSFATALGNMAKSMISLNQSHTGILKTLKQVEVLLGELGLSDVNLNAESVLQARRQNEAAAAEAFAGISKAMDQVSATLEAAGAALEESRRLREEQRQENAVLAQNLAQGLAQGLEDIRQSLAGLQGGGSGRASGGAGVQPENLAGTMAGTAAEAPARSKVLHLPGSQPGLQVNAGLASPGSPAGTSTQPETADTPRRLLQLPLVVRLESGNYMSAGGKNLGKVNLNDVKAMLAQAHQPPEHYQLRWEQNTEGLWAILEQPGLEAGRGRVLRLLMREIVSAKGLEVFEIASYFDNDLNAHPVEFCRFLNEILG